MNYEVIVGNIGTVYSGDNTLYANEIYITYVRSSHGDWGREAGEPVTLLCNGEIIEEYAGDDRLRSNG